MKRNTKEQQVYRTLLGEKRFLKSKKRKNKTSYNSNSARLKVYPHKVLSYILESKDKIYPNKNHISEKVFRINNDGIFFVPKVFSLSEDSEKSFDFLNRLYYALFNQTNPEIIIDYAECEHIDMDAQVVMDIILKYFILYLKKRDKHGIINQIKTIDAKNPKNEDCKKILFAVGTHAIFRDLNLKFNDLIPYKLCVGNHLSKNASQNKEIDTTKLVDYVIECLERLNKKLTWKKKKDLCQIIGEVLINSEEHSSTNYRYSIGFFQETVSEENHSGIFNLVILNFGETIYEKFKDPECPTKHIVEQMQELSKVYTKRNFFSKNEFEEETLWTLYSLQDGVTTKINYKKRGNGSIRFIESFFNLSKNTKTGERDKISKLTIHSGNAKIIFDGTYQISEEFRNNSNMKMMTFNNTKDLRDKPDSKYVKFTKNYFPGTLISAKILLTEDDFIQNEKK